MAWVNVFVHACGFEELQHETRWGFAVLNGSLAVLSAEAGCLAVLYAPSGHVLSLQSFSVN